MLAGTNCASWAKAKLQEIFNRLEKIYPFQQNYSFVKIESIGRWQIKFF